MTARRSSRSCPDAMNPHPICGSSDSGLPYCRCWCAECRDYMTEVRAAYSASDMIARVISQLEDVTR